MCAVAMRRCCATETRPKAMQPTDAEIRCEESRVKLASATAMWPAVAAAALALATLAAIEPRGLFGDVRTRRSDDEVKPRLFDILS